jgi:hypothetical protein
MRFCQWLIVISVGCSVINGILDHDKVLHGKGNVWRALFFASLSALIYWGAGAFSHLLG